MTYRRKYIDGFYSVVSDCNIGPNLKSISGWVARRAHGKEKDPTNRSQSSLSGAKVITKIIISG